MKGFYRKDDDCITDELKYIEIPMSMVEYAKTYATNISVSFNSADGINGYGRIWHKSVVVSRYAEWCVRENCNYHSINNPDGRGEKCKRHNLERGYVPVFMDNMDSPILLSESWNKWIEENENVGKKKSPKKWRAKR